MQQVCIGSQPFELYKSSEGNMTQLRTHIFESFSLVYIISHCGRFSYIFCLRGTRSNIITDLLNGSTFVAPSNANVACDVHVTLAKRKTRGVTKRKSRDETLAKGGVYRREIKNKATGELTGQVKYEPRLKRDRQSLSLGQYDARAEARIVRDIALNFYENHEFGYLDFEDGGYSVGELHSKGDRYFVIPPLTEKLEGKEKSRLVSSEAKKIYKHFKKKQAEYWEQVRGEAFSDSPGIGNIELISREGEPGNATDNISGPSDARSLDTPLGQPSYSGQYVGNLPVEGSVLNIPGMLISHFGDAVEPPQFDVSTDPLTLSNCYDESWMDDIVGGLPGEDAQRKFEPSGRHILNYEPAPADVAPGPNNAPASAFNINEVEALLLQVVSTSQQEKQLVHQELVNTLQQDKNELKQEKQELKRKVSELEAQVSEMRREYQEHMNSCCSRNRPSKKRGGLCEIGELGGS